MLALIVGTTKGMPPARVDILGWAALLPDVGLMRPPRDLIGENTPLTPQVFQFFPTYPQLGAAVLEESLYVESDLVTIIT